MKQKFKVGWKFDKKINLSNLLTAGMLAASIFWWAANIEKRIAVLEVEFKALYTEQSQSEERQDERDDKQETDLSRLYSTIDLTISDF